MNRDFLAGMGGRLASAFEGLGGEGGRRGEGRWREVGRYIIRERFNERVLKGGSRKLVEDDDGFMNFFFFATTSLWWTAATKREIDRTFDNCNF